ncbi:MAG: 2-amino-4-hydroxy-6-hydroxymethyldihydropteridine diphosphokinase [Pseudomonadota bacterium]
MSQAPNALPQRQIYLVAMGANLPSRAGPPRQTLSDALNYTGHPTFELINASRFFSCPAFPAGNGPDYVNAAASFWGPPHPEDMLAILHSIENEFGRERKQRWGQRTLDLDLIASGDVVLPDEETQSAWRVLETREQLKRAPAELVLPHPRLQDRAFVLVPLAEIAPGWVHPILGKTTLELRDALPPEMLNEMVPLA